MFLNNINFHRCVDKEGAVDYEYKGGEIEFKDIHFSYENGRKLINGLNLSIPSKKIVAFCGESGVGKTTIYNLLVRCFRGNELRIFKYQYPQYIHIYNLKAKNYLLY